MLFFVGRIGVYLSDNLIFSGIQASPANHIELHTLELCNQLAFLKLLKIYVVRSYHLRPLLRLSKLKKGIT